MEFVGRIQKVFPLQSGVSQNGNNWERLDFVFEYFENPSDRYSDKVLLDVMNDRIKELDLKEGDQVRIGFGHSVREYNGKVFNQLRAYKIEKIAPDNGTNGANGNNGTNGNGDEKKEDDLPF